MPVNCSKSKTTLSVLHFSSIKIKLKLITLILYVILRRWNVELGREHPSVLRALARTWGWGYFWWSQINTVMVIIVQVL